MVIVNIFVYILRFSEAIVSGQSCENVVRRVILDAGWGIDYKVLTLGCRALLESICYG